MKPLPSDIWTCSNCENKQIISHLGFFDLMTCPHCSNKSRVHTQLAQFKLERIIGRGGMSVVLQAYDTELDRQVAIKILNSSYRNSAECIARFEKECDLLARVQHPNITTVYTAGHERGYFYIAMELLQGKNLESGIKTLYKMHPFAALKITHEVAMGLKAAYEMGVVHRDIKPGNIILSLEGQAKLIDFGLSLEVNEKDTSETIWATPYYASPETLRQQQEDERSDIYALGMTLRSLLTARDSFSASPQNTEEWLSCKQKLPSISRLDTQLDSVICGLVDTMTNYNKEKRPTNYQSLIELLEDSMETVQAKMARQHPWQRYRSYVISSGVLALCCTLFALVLPLFYSNSPKDLQDIDSKIYLLSNQEGQQESKNDILQLQLALMGNSLDDALSVSSSLSYDSPDPLLGMWALQIKWSLYYLESGDSPTLAKLCAQMEQMRQSESYTALEKSPLGQAFLQLEAGMTSDQSVSLSGVSTIPASAGLKLLAIIVTLKNAELADDKTTATAQMEKLRKELSTRDHPIRVLKSALEYTQRRLDLMEEF